MYAIIETGGKQYKVEPEMELEVELIKSEAGDEVVLDRVLMINNDGEIKAGTPYVDGAKVVCKLLGSSQGEKVDVFNYKRRKNIRRKIGHRQDYSRLQVQEIVG